MAYTRGQLEEAIEKVAPSQFAYDWDNSGYNLKLHNEIRRVLVCEDATGAVIAEAIRENCDTIISHHPLLFREIRRIDREDPIGKRICALVEGNLNLYCAHTSFDCAPGGLNDVFARKIGLQKMQPLSPEIGRIGELNTPISLNELAKSVKETLDAPTVFIEGEEKAVKKVAVVTGAGGEFARIAKDRGADVLITGEAKHNELVEAREIGIPILAAGHYTTERLFVAAMADGLQKACHGLQYKITIVPTKAETGPYGAV